MPKERVNYLLYAVIIVLLNVLLSFVPLLRWDLTADNSFSLSSVSRKAVSEIKDPLTIKIFFSTELPPQYAAVRRYLQDLMREYKGAANDNFRYEFVDVDSQENRRAASSYGIYPLQVREIKSDKYSQRAAYMGLVVIHQDLVEKIDRIVSADGLEYRITTTINKMVGKLSALLALQGKIKMTVYASGNLTDIEMQGLDKLQTEFSSLQQALNKENFNKIEYRFVDPEQEKQTDEVAKKYGLQKLVWKAGRTATGKRIDAGEALLAIVLEHGQRFQTIQIPFGQTLFGGLVIGNIKGLKDKINKGIETLVTRSQSIGYVTGHGEAKLDDARRGAGNFKEAVSRVYKIRSLSLTNQDVPTDVNTLVINGPQQNFGDMELYKLDQFLMKGGSILFLIDSYRELNLGRQRQFQRQGPVFMPINTGLNKLLKHYGVTVNRNYVLDKQCFINRGRGGQRDQKLYFAPEIGRTSMDGGNPITRYLKKLIFLKVSSLTLDNKKLDKFNIKHKKLVTSSDQAWLMQGRIDLRRAFPPKKDPRAKKDPYARHTLVALLEGKFPSYYAEKLPDKVKAELQKKGLKTEAGVKLGVKPARIIVAGTSELANAQLFDKSARYPNALFVMNMIDYLAGNEDVPLMRSKGLPFNPLDETSDTLKTILKVINVGGVPVLVILIGFLIWRRREARKQRLKEQFADQAAV